MFSRSLSMLLIFAITACPVMCHLGACACDDAHTTAIAEINQSCCSGHPGNNGATPTKDSSDKRTPCKKTCICGGAVLGHGVELDLVCQCLLDVLLPLNAALDGSATTRNNDLNPGDRPVRSGRMIRYQLMSLLC